LEPRGRARSTKSHIEASSTALNQDVLEPTLTQIDEGKIQEHLGEVVRSTVEETLNAMLDAEADRLCRADGYERTEAGRTREPVPISGSCTPKWAKSR